MKLSALLPGSLVLVGILSSAAFSADFFVSPTGSDTAACTESDPCSFQKALTQAANNGEADTIYVKPGTYRPSSTLTADITDGMSLTIVAENTGGPPPILSGDSDDDGTPDIQIMDIRGTLSSGEKITISHLVFEKGKADDANPDPSVNVYHGGGLYVRIVNGTIIVEKCIFRDNYADGFGSGAFLYTGGGHVIVVGSEFSNNGGGWYALNASSVTGTGGVRGDVEVLNSVFKNNASGHIGGLAENIDIYKNTFEGGIRGAKFSYYGSMDLFNNFFNDAGTVTITAWEGIQNIVNNTFYVTPLRLELNGNITSGNVYNNIFWGELPVASLGIYNDWRSGDGTSSATANVFNNIFPCSDDINDCIYDYDEPGLILHTGSNFYADPLFVNPSAGDLHIQPTSPAVDMGDLTAPGLPSHDFDGNPRIIGASVDIGADEVTGFSTAGHLYVAPDGAGSLCTEDNPCRFHTAMNIASRDRVDSFIHVKEGDYIITSTLGYYSDGNDLVIQPWDPSRPKPRIIADTGVDIRLMTIGAGDNNVTVKGLEFRNGNATAGNGMGGALLMTGEGTLIVEDCVFINNRADADGGALKMESGAGTLIVNRSEFYNNASYGLPPGCCGGGGAVDVRSSRGKATVMNSVFRGNYASVNGGAVEAYTITGEIRIESNVFEGNAGRTGGALHAGAINGTIAILNNMFNNNTSASEGGAVVMTNHPSSVGCLNRRDFKCEPSPVRFYLINNTFHSNIAKAAGASNIFVGSDDSELYVYNNIVWGNTSLEYMRGREMLVNTKLPPTDERPEIRLYSPLIEAVQQPVRTRCSL